MPSTGSSSWSPGSHVHVRGKRWRIGGVTRGADCTALRLTELGAVDGRTLTILTPFDRPVPIEGSTAPLVARPRRWLHELDRATAEVRPYGSLAATARSEIRVLPYQLEPALAMLRHNVTRILIADGVGLGKTIQAGIVLLELSTRDDTFRGLVLVPAGLRDQWSAELAAHFALTSTRADAAWLLSTASERPPDINPWSLPGIYVASHDFVKRPEALRPLEDVVWDLVIVDEAHAAALGTDRRAAIDAIACRACRVMLLTATPNAGNAYELASLCRLGRIDETGAAAAIFSRSREDVDLMPPRRSRVVAVHPSRAEQRMHQLLHRYSVQVWKEATARHDDRARLASIILRKRALSSAASLVDSVRRRMDLLATLMPETEHQLTLPLVPLGKDDDAVDDADPSAVLAVPGLADSERERRWLAAIAEAGRVAARAETKTVTLLRLIRRIREPVIVFTEYRDTLARLERRLASAGRSVLTLHGGMTPSERHLVTRRFNDGGHVLLATDAASEGLNLQHRCRTVIHYELPWNPARLEQRAGRIDRLGQSRRVHELSLVAADTAERLVIEPLLKRARQARATRAGLRMLDALSDSRVAEAVMSATRLESVEVLPVQPDGRDAAPLALTVEARQEAERLIAERDRVARSQPDRRQTAPVVSILSRRTSGSGPTSGLILVYELAISTADDRWIHAETLVLNVRDVTWPSRPAANVVRALVESFAKPDNPQVASVVNARAARMVDEVAAIARPALEQLRRRQTAIAAVRQSTARQLVQPGLFDRRSAPKPVDPIPIVRDETFRPRARLIAALYLDDRRVRR